MSSYESSPLTGAELFPKRIESGSVHTLEKFVSYGTLLLAVAATGVCVAYGVKYHIEHVLLAFVIVVSAVHFYLLLRMYQKDDLQDRKMVYLGCFVVLFVSVVGILYAINWVPSDPFYGCTNAWFHPPTTGYPKGICAPTMPTIVNPSQSCYKLAPISSSTGPAQVQFTLLPAQVPQNVTCQDGLQWAQACTNTNGAKDLPKFVCK
eukprot:m.58333 g.58333  ORF g.58333 m.58333 type:complete len:206 (-) comp13140_c0_seq1:366-983(-)